MKQGINTIYHNAAAEFSERVSSLLGGQVHSVVLYGSVARRQAKRERDVDILVVAIDYRARAKVLDIAYELENSTEFEAFISVVYFTRDDIYRIHALGSPFISSIVEDGIILYDDGTFAGLRKRVPASR